MNQENRERIKTLRRALDADPDSIVTGHLRGPASAEDIGDLRLPQWQAPYARLVEAFNGGRLGTLVFWDTNELIAQQVHLGFIGARRQEWLRIGQAVSEDVLLHRSGKIILVVGDDDNFERGDFRTRSSLDALVADLTGPGYRELFGGHDPWWRLLVQLGFAPSK
jgi:hypothetical protein